MNDDRFFDNVFDLMQYITVLRDRSEVCTRSPSFYYQGSDVELILYTYFVV